LFIDHFQKKNQVKVNLQLSTYKIKTSSAEACAKFCLDTSVIDSDAFKCLSFDYCASQEGCSFYNFTLTTDPSIITESSPNCDHYSSSNLNWTFFRDRKAISFECRPFVVGILEGWVTTWHKVFISMLATLSASNQILAATIIP